MVKGQWVIQGLSGRTLGWASSGVWAKTGCKKKITPEKSGKLEPQVKDAGNLPQKQEKEKKEGFTAWGKEVGGLQAGLDFKPRREADLPPW